MGGFAAQLIEGKQYGQMVSLNGSTIMAVPLEKIAGKARLVNEDNDLIIQGKRMGICFG